jgi:hypothetical protein
MMKQCLENIGKGLLHACISSIYYIIKKSYIYKNNCGEEAQIETIRLVYFGLPH